MKKLLSLKFAPYVLCLLILIYVLSLIYTLSMLGKVSYANFQEKHDAPAVSSGGLKYQNGMLSESSQENIKENNIFIKAVSRQ